LAFNAPKTAVAQPAPDRSLNADKPSTEPQSKAAAVAEALKSLNLNAPTSAVPMLTATAPGQDQAKAGAGDKNAITDLSSLSREQLEARVKTLSESLAASNTEAEFFRQRWQDLRLRDEALGVEALTVDESKLEDKLVQAVKELYQSEMKRREALQLLSKILNTTGQLLQTAPNFDPKVRADYEVASRAARDYLAGHSGSSIPLGSSIADAKIADLHPELNVVILNVGKTEGVKEGMLFALYQDAQQVGVVRVVLARDLVCAAMVQDIKAKVTLKVGDRAQVNTGP